LARITPGLQLTASNILKVTEPLLCRLAEPVSIVLVLNRESMLLDPVDWSSLKADLRDWAIAHSRSIEIPEYTDNRFRERVPASYKPREVYHKRDLSRSVYHFFDSHSPRRDEASYLIELGIPSDSAKLINKINKHDRALGVLGVMPNQFRAILKGSLENWEEV
jgi:hypothetical protein